jgi:hypothetical protein
MLFPLQVFTEDAASLGGLSLKTLSDLRERYQASWEATANRLVSTTDSACAMVVLRLRIKPTEARRGPFLPGLEPRPKLRVDYTVRSKSLEDRFVPPHKSVPEDSVLYHLAGTDRSGDHVAGIEDWSALGLGVVELEGMCLPTEWDEAKLLVILHPVV